MPNVFYSEAETQAT